MNMVSDLENQIQRLESNPDSELEEVKSYHSNLMSKLNELNQKYESQIKETPNIPLVLGTYSRRWSRTKRKISPEIKLISLSLAYKARESSSVYLIENMEPANRDIKKIKKLAIKFLRNYSSSIENISEFSGTAYYPSFPGDSGAFAFKTLPIDVLRDWNLHQFPDIINSIMALMTKDVTNKDFYINSRSGYEYLEGLIIHENTHSYIKSNLGGDLGYRSINEAAAQATSSMVSGEIDYARLETRIENYRDKGESFSRRELQFWKEVFIRYSEEFEKKPEKIYNIRRSSVKACRLRRKRSLTPESFYKLPFVERLTLVEMVLGNEEEELRKLWYKVDHLENAEKACFHSLVILDILPEEVMENQIKRVDNSIKKGFLKGLRELIPDSDTSEDYLVGLISESDSEQNEKERFLFDMGTLEKGIEELKSVLKREKLTAQEKEDLEILIQNLKQIIRLYEEENKVATNYNEKFSEKYDEEADEIGEWIRERVGDPKKTDPVRLGENMELNLERIIEDYEKVIDTGLEYTEEILELLEQIYNREERLKTIFRKHKKKEDYEHLQKLENKTSELHEIVKDSEGRLNQAKEEIAQAKQV